MTTFINCMNNKICSGICITSYASICKNICLDCRYCNIDIKLQYVSSVECPICFEVEEGVKQLNCDHSVCIKCFKRCHFNISSIANEFPYKDVINIEEYYEDHLNPIWKQEYPLIEEWSNSLIEAVNLSKNESYLKCCPLCRK